KNVFDVILGDDQITADFTKVKIKNYFDRKLRNSQRAGTKLLKDIDSNNEHNKLLGECLNPEPVQLP
ncbi:Hypothetical predicted protein, partial [Mytilus galloprovincialis]